MKLETKGHSRAACVPEDVKDTRHLSLFAQLYSQSEEEDEM
jgi:hypothetical protein